MYMITNLNIIDENVKGTHFIYYACHSAEIKKTLI